MKKLYQGAKVVCPGGQIEEEKDFVVEDGLISAVDSPGSISGDDFSEKIDLSGQVACPGFVDIHVHLREPGYEWKETIQSGSASAAKGGFTDICCMPNTNPVNDSASVTEFILSKAEISEGARVHPIGAVSIGLKGEEMAPLHELYEAGCVAFSDDGFPVRNAGMMRRAMEYLKPLGGVIAGHEEELSLSQGFSMNESELSVRMGLQGMPDAAENVMIARDIELAHLTGARIHFCHVSNARAVKLIERAKEDGLPVTAEVAPHHLVLTEDRVDGYRTDAKMSMPLRSEADILALQEGLARGVIDCVATDHAPHEADSKSTDFAHASFGIIGLETALPLMLELYRDGQISLSRLVESLTSSARACYSMDIQTFSVGQPADICVFDPGLTEEVTQSSILSKSKNTPFIGEEMKGLVTRTIVDGQEVYQRESK